MKEQMTSSCTHFFYLGRLWNLHYPFSNQVVIHGNIQWTQFDRSIWMACGLGSHSRHACGQVSKLLNDSLVSYIWESIYILDYVVGESFVNSKGAT